MDMEMDFSPREMIEPLGEYHNTTPGNLLVAMELKLALEGEE